jgi:hypothetical protein
MSKDDMHPELRYQAEIDGWSQSAADIDRDAFTAYQQFKMVLCPSPQIRRATLNEIDKEIGGSGTLRSKSQLLELRRKLSHTHEALLRSGR